MPSGESRTRSKRRRVDYAAVENQFDDIEESDVQDDDLQEVTQVGEYADDDDDDEEHVFPRKTKRSRETEKPSQEKKRKDEDDDSFSEFESEEDDFTESGTDESEYEKRERRRADSQFVSRDSEDDGNEDGEYAPGSKKRKHKKRKRQSSAKRSRTSRSRKRSIKVSEDEDSIDEEDADDHVDLSDQNTLEQELDDLRDSDDEVRGPRERSLRQRTKEVNYTIPPPLTDNLDGLSEIQEEPTTPRRKGGNSSLVRKLFPTGGPFGGGDVTSIFGKNPTGLTGAQPGNLLAGGADSDSSDDDITPVSGAKRPSISGSMGIIKTPKKKQNADTDPLGVDMNIDFSSVGGLDNYINQLKEMVALPLLYPEVYQKFGITPPRGVLFHGPPGTGKTLMARALAASCSSEGRNITFFMRKGADCLSKWVGEAERQLRLLFEEARKQQPSIIFFDEIDGLAPVRSSKQEQIHASIVSTLLALMDGMDGRGQVIVIGATNRPDAIDPALRRPGRFDREFYFPLPDLKAREQILTIHTKKWDPPLSKEFLEKVAHFTKGYGGADLRALCTEAALNSIQRRYPQIYQSKEKLKIDPDSIHVAARDFMKALDKIVPSSSRSTSSGSAPLPDYLKSLLEVPLNTITIKLDKLVPRVKVLTSLEEAEYVDPSENDIDGGFGKHELIKRLEASRVHRPRLLISGDSGNGQQYLGSAVLNHLEGFNVQSLDLGQLFGDSTRTAENAIIQSFVEARRHKPSIIYIPNVDIWYDTVPESAKSTLAGLLRSVASNERILLLGVADTPYEELDEGLKVLFGISDANHVILTKPTRSQRAEFFKPLWNALTMKPSDFLDNRKRKKLEKLEVVEVAKTDGKEQDLKSFEKLDMKLKNTLKIKLAGLMDLLKVRYKRFKKPTIDDYLLIHLFEPSIPSVSQAYTKDGDMIVETATGRRFHNMDLDVIEERLWNGFYSEPKQFLKDIEMIYKDAIMLNDREKLIKASEMFANVQVHIDEISTPEFIEQCKGLRQRELQRIREANENVNGLSAIDETKEPQTGVAATAPVISGGEDGTLLKHSSDGNVPVVSVEGLNQVASEVSNGSNGHSEDTIQPSIGSTQTIETEETELHAVEVTKAVGIEEPEAAEPEATEPPFVINMINAKATEDFLLDDTEELCVDELEQINANLMDIVWEDRHSWERNSTLEKLSNQIVNIQREFGTVERPN